MKKLTSLLLALSLCLSLAISTPAADYQSYTFNNNNGSTITFEAAAMSTEKLSFIVLRGNETGDGLIEAVEKDVSCTVLTPKAGSSITVTGPYGCHPYVLNNEGIWAESMGWYDWINGPVENTFSNRDDLMFTLDGPDGRIYVKLGSQNISFSDVAPDAYYAEAVNWAIENGITNGTSATTFSPETICNNEQILTFLWRANGSPETDGKNPFENVDENAYYYKAAMWASENDMISGGHFNGSVPCTRSSTVTYMWILAGRPTPASQPSFTDVPADSDYAQAVAWAVENGITNGTSDTTFSPDTICTRGQIATFLHRGLAK